jgi:predicted  nucleic acid-binding Zn-ribbon protein
MEFIEEYRRLTNDIEATQSYIASLERKLNKLISTYAPRDLKAVSFEIGKARTNKELPDVFELADEINRVKTEIKSEREELHALTGQRKRLEDCVSSADRTHIKVVMLKIKGMPISQIMYMTGYSERQVYRILSDTQKTAVNGSDSVV